jgi:hypothetical protein
LACSAEIYVWRPVVGGTKIMNASLMGQAEGTFAR